MTENCQIELSKKDKMKFNVQSGTVSRSALLYFAYFLYSSRSYSFN